MASVNKVILVGNLTRDPQLNYLPSQTAAVEFGLATNRKWKGQDGQQKEEVCFVDVVAFGKTAETLSQYLKKGNLVYIEGRLKFEQWKGQDGSNRSKLRVLVDSFQFLPNGQQNGQQQAPATQQPGYTNPDYNPNYVPSGDDEIPF